MWYARNAECGVSTGLNKGWSAKSNGLFQESKLMFFVTECPDILSLNVLMLIPSKFKQFSVLL